VVGLAFVIWQRYSSGDSISHPFWDTQDASDFSWLKPLVIILSILE
jgi:hypothetical protein